MFLDMAVVTQRLAIGLPAIDPLHWFAHGPQSGLLRSEGKGIQWIKIRT